MTNDENELQQSGRRSIRDIPIPRRRPTGTRAAGDGVRSTRPAREVAEEPEQVSVEDEDPMPPVRRAPEPEADRLDDEPAPRAYRAERSRRRPRVWVKLVAVAVPVAAAFWLFTWHSASIEITEKRAERQITLNLPVSIGDQTATGTLAAKSVKAVARAEKTLPATGEATVQSKAVGSITIVNEYSDEPQTLVRNTRFQTADGLIFRIQEPVTVPGKTSSGGGTVTARVEADDVGVAYNVGPVARFTIPGFSGKPQFDTFYAKSSEPMTGGFDGIQKVADPELVADAVDELTEQLRDTIEAKAAAEAGAGYRAFSIPGSFAVTSTGREPSGDKVTVWVESEAEAFAVAETELADALASAIMPGYRAKGEARIEDAEGIRVTPKDGATPTLEVVGLAKVTWTVDIQSLESSLVGQPLTAFDQVVGRFGGIERATPIVRPFWRSTFPSDSNSIETTASPAALVDEKAA